MNTTINRGEKEREWVGWLVGWGLKSQSEIDYSMRADFKSFKGEDNQKILWDTSCRPTVD
jgi:hypothetical protein